MKILKEVHRMDEFKQRLIHLHHCRGVGWKTIFQLLQSDNELQSLYHLSANSLAPSLSKTIPKTFFQDLYSHSIPEQIRQYSLNEIHLITYFDDHYPALLRETYQPPWVLYARGNIELLKNPHKLAVVGSRQATQYGKKAIDLLFPKMIEKGILIVSGLATGIDTYAHQSTIKLGGETIAIIAGGLYHIYPSTNKDLALHMMRHQLVLSEYPPHTKPSRWHFPVRNRIISGMSLGTFIIEAKQKSGSLITANFALQEGREVFALPGNIVSPFSEGPNELIQQGAKLVKSPEDIFEELLI